MSPEALSALITAIFVAGGSWLISYLTTNAALKATAKKDEVQLLRDEVGRLQVRVQDLTNDVDKWRKRYDDSNEKWQTRYERLNEKYIRLQGEFILLCKVLEANKIAIPKTVQENLEYLAGVDNSEEVTGDVPA